jgi:transposase InsO family protein
MSSAMTAQLVTDALTMALWRRGKPSQLLHHSDQGSQYTSELFQEAPGRSWDHLQHEPTRRLLGQCGDGKLLLHDEDLEDEQEKLHDERRSQSGCL